MTASRWSVALVTAIAATLFGQPAHAGPDRTPAQPRSARTIELLQSLGGPPPGGSSLAQHLAQVGLSGKYGLTYTRRLNRGEKGMRLRLRGPALGHESAVGLSVEVRF